MPCPSPRLLIATITSASLLLSGCGSDDNDNSSSGQQQPAFSQAEVLLRVMETTDIHANLMNHNYYNGNTDDSVGLVKTATLIRQARAEVDNSVLVDNGDLLQGSPLGDYFAKIETLKNNQVHPIYKAMNLLDYDVANIGNHEFNFGLPFLKEAIDDAAFPYISANVFFDDADDNPDNDIPYFQPYVIQKKVVLDNAGNSHELNIGYIGFVPPQIMQWDKSNLETRVIAKDMVEMANKYVPQMKQQGADVVIAIPHSGLTTSSRQGGDENASYYLSQVDGIDAILFGHAHRTFPGDASYNNLNGVDNSKGTINGVAAVMPGFWGNHLGYIDLKLVNDAQGNWQVKDSQTVLKAIAKTENRVTTALVESDIAITEAIAQDHQQVSDWVSAPFARISAPIHSYFALVQDDPSIQVVTDAQRAYVEKITRGTDLESLPILSVGAPFRAGRGGASDYTYLQAGDVSYGNVADLYIYPNTLKVLQLSGAEVKEWLEMSAGQFNQIVPGSSGSDLINPDFPSYNFDVIDGVSYQVDVSQPAKYDKNGTLINPQASRIINLQYQGAVIGLSQEFLVISNNYRASGGGNFPAVNASRIVIDAPDENRQTVADYLIAETAKAPASGFDPSADNNWSLAPLAGTSVQLLSSASDSAKNFAAEAGLVFEGTNQDGFGIYRLELSATAR